MKCLICSGETRRAFDMCSRRVDQTVPVFRCGACDAYFSNGGATNYDDADLTEYYTRYAAAIRARYNRLMTEIERYCSVGSLIDIGRSEEHTSELQSLMRISYAVFCLKKKKKNKKKKRDIIRMTIII